MESRGTSTCGIHASVSVCVMIARAASCIKCPGLSLTFALPSSVFRLLSSICPFTTMSPTVSQALMRLANADEPNAPWCWSEWQTLSGSTLAPWQASDAANEGKYLIETWNADAVQKVAAFRERYWQLSQNRQAYVARAFLSRAVDGDEDVHIRGRALWAEWVKETKKKVKFTNEYGIILEEGGVCLAEYLARHNSRTVSGSCRVRDNC